LPKIWLLNRLWCQEEEQLKWNFLTGNNPLIHKIKNLINLKIIINFIKTRLNEKAKTIEGQEQMPLRAVAYALEVIPRTLA
jgi:hypothetical protein